LLAARGNSKTACGKQQISDLPAACSLVHSVIHYQMFPMG